MWSFNLVPRETDSSFGCHQYLTVIIGFQVAKLADALSIQLRVGCFCNIGACQRLLGLSSQQIRDNFLVRKKISFFLLFSFTCVCTLLCSEAGVITLTRQMMCCCEMLDDQLTIFCLFNENTITAPCEFNANLTLPFLDLRPN